MKRCYIRWENTHGTTHSEISHGQMTNVHIFSTLFLTDFLAVYFRTEKGGVQPKTSSGLLPNDILAWASVSQKNSLFLLDGVYEGGFLIIRTVS